MLSRLRLLVLCGVAAASALLVVHSLSLGYALTRPLPYWDQWEFIKSIPDILSGRYGLSDLVSQHNEHRIATSRLVFILDLLYFDGSTDLSVAVLYATLVMLALMLAVVTHRSPAIRATLFVLFLSLLVSPAQWENLSSGFQIQFPLVDLFAFLSVALLMKALNGAVPRRWAVLFLVAASLADLFAVFSMASGILTLVPALWVGVTLRRRLRLVGLYAAAHAVYSLLFFYHYARSGDIAATYNPIALTHYVVVYMGACLRGYAHAPVLLGFVDCALLAFALGLTLWRSARDRSRLDPVQVFATGIGLLLVAGAYLTATGRGSLGLQTAISSRYSLQSIIVQIVLFIFYWRLWDAGSVPGSRRAALRTGLLVVFFGISVTSNASPLSREEWDDRVNTLDTAGYAMSNGVFADGVLQSIYPWPNLVREPAAYLASHKLGPFSPRFGEVFRPPQNVLAGLDLDKTEACTAQFGAKRTGPEWLELEGWAFDPTDPTGDGWILALDEADGRRVVGFGRQSVERLDVDAALKVEVGRSGFDIALNSPALADTGPRTLTIVLVPEAASRPNCKATIRADAIE